MPKRSQEEKCFLNMAGEFLVAAELNRRSISSAVTYGSSKSADVWAFNADSQKAVRIEVKATGSDSKSWVIGNKAILEENWKIDMFWVLVRLPKPMSSGPPEGDAERGLHSPQFFVFTAKELGTIVGARDANYREKYLAKHKKEFSTGVPKLFLSEAIPFENRWEKLEKRISRIAGT